MSLISSTAPPAPPIDLPDPSPPLAVFAQKMENMGDWEQKNLIKELVKGRELASQLKIHLNMPSSSPETREFLVEKILSSYEKALSMLSLSTSSVPGGAILRMSESPPSLAGSPRIEDSDRDFKDQDASGKR